MDCCSQSSTTCGDSLLEKLRIWADELEYTIKDAVRKPRYPGTSAEGGAVDCPSIVPSDSQNNLSRSPTKSPINEPTWQDLAKTAKAENLNIKEDTSKTFCEVGVQKDIEEKVINREPPHNKPQPPGSSLIRSRKGLHHLRAMSQKRYSLDDYHDRDTLNVDYVVSRASSYNGDSDNHTVSTKYDLLDQQFYDDTPVPLDGASKLISTIRKRTTCALGNHDSENDPSLSLETLNAEAERGDLVLPVIKCDIAIRISKKIQTDVLEWLLITIRGSGLIVTSSVGCSGDYFLSVTATREMFLRGAEDMELYKRVRPEKGDGMKPFSITQKARYCPRQSTDGFLTASERQLIVYNYLVDIRVDEAISFNKQKLTFHQNEAILSSLIGNGLVIQVYPLHQKSKQNVLNRLWVWNLIGRQPLGLIRHYFGEEIGLYFAWLGLYTFVLIIPSIIGLAITTVYDHDDTEEADWCFTFYAFFNVVWPTLFLELWKRRSSALAWEWNTLELEVECREQQRPQFWGKLGKNEITGQTELQYPTFTRQMKQTISLVISVFCITGVGVTMVTILRFDEYVQAMIQSNSLPFYIPNFAILYLPKVVLPVAVGILDAIYNKIAVSLNEWENHRTQRDYENWLVLKLILFKFVNHFLALFYIAFYLVDFDKLRDTLAALLITKQILGNFGEVLGPTVTSFIKVYLLKRRATTSTSTENRKLSQIEAESEKPAYENTFDDYLEMFIQLGYVILFSAAYPIAAFWALLNNVLEIRVDGFKLVNGIQRPFIKRVENIGFWEDAFEVLSVISIIVNCALIGIRGQVGRWFPNSTSGQQILFVIGMEHIFLTMKFVISRSIPDIPAWVEVARMKERYNRFQTLKGVESFARTARITGKLRKRADEARERLSNTQLANSDSHLKEE